LARALITGGAGFIGSHLAQELFLRGYSITILDDLSTGRMENLSAIKDHPDVDIIIDTITNDILMDRLIASADIIFHLAAAVGVKLIVEDPVGVINRNVFGTEVVLKVNARYGKKIILASSSEVYGKGEAAPFQEDSDRILGPTTKTRWCYSCTKAVDEFLALSYYNQIQMPVSIARFFNTIGVRQIGRYGMVVPSFIEQAISHAPITVYGDGSQIRCFIDVRDMVEAIILLGENKACDGEIYNIGSEEAITIVDLARLIKKLANSRSEIRFTPFEKIYTKGFEDIKIRIPDITKVKNQLGFSPRFSLEETLSEILRSRITMEEKIETAIKLNTRPFINDEEPMNPVLIDNF
jgi:UDP-glucose 4-epimerase